MKNYKKSVAMIVLGTIISAGMFAVDIGNGLSFNGFGLAGVSLAENQSENLAFGLDNNFGMLEAAYTADRGGAKMLFITTPIGVIPSVAVYPYAYVNFFKKIFTISAGNNYEPLWATGGTDSAWGRWWNYLDGLAGTINVDLAASTKGLVVHNFEAPGVRFELSKIEKVKGLRLAWYLGIPGVKVDNGRFTSTGVEVGNLFDNMFVAAGYENEKIAITGAYEQANSGYATQSGVYANLDTTFNAFKLNAVVNWVFTDPGFFRVTPTFVFTDKKLQKMELYARGDLWFGIKPGSDKTDWNLIDAKRNGIVTDPASSAASILGAEVGFSYLVKTVKLNISVGADNFSYFKGNGFWAKVGTGFDISENLKFELYDKLGKVGADKDFAGSAFDNIVQLNMMWRF